MSAWISKRDAASAGLPDPRALPSGGGCRTSAVGASARPALARLGEAPRGGRRSLARSPVPCVVGMPRRRLGDWRRAAAGRLAPGGAVATRVCLGALDVAGQDGSGRAGPGAGPHRMAPIWGWGIRGGVGVLGVEDGRLGDARVGGVGGGEGGGRALAGRDGRCGAVVNRWYAAPPGY